MCVSEALIKQCTDKALLLRLIADAIAVKDFGLAQKLNARLCVLELG